MKKELRDQSAHVAVGLLCLAPLAVQPNIFTGAFAGLVCGLIREVTEAGAPVTPRKVLSAFRSYLDLNYWAAAGAIAGIIGSYAR